MSSPSPIRAWMIWGIATLFPIYQLAIQIGYGSLESGIKGDLQLTLFESSLLSSAFLITYALMQLPAGWLLDRLSPRWLLAASALLCGFSAYGFARSDSLADALFFRCCLGLFAAFGFPGAGLLARRWISSSLFVLAMGLIDFFFGLGAIGGEAGFAILLEEGKSWRAIMEGLAIAGIAIGGLCAVWIRDRPDGMEDRSSRVHVSESLRILLLNRQVRWALLFYSGMIGTAFGFGGLWDIRLQAAFGFGATESINLNSWLFVGLAISAPIAGIVADRLTNRRPLLFVGALGSLVGVAALIFITVWIPYWAVAFNLVFTGFFLGTSVAIFGVACDAVPPRYAGTTIALVNGAGCFWGALLQLVPSLLIGPGDFHPLEAYQHVLSIYILFLLCSLFASFKLSGSKEAAR